MVDTQKRLESQNRGKKMDDQKAKMVRELEEIKKKLDRLEKKVLEKKQELKKEKEELQKLTQDGERKRELVVRWKKIKECFEICLGQEMTEVDIDNLLKRLFSDNEPTSSNQDGLQQEIEQEIKEEEEQEKATKKEKVSQEIDISLAELNLTDPYEVLGIKTGASLDEIKKVYKREALKWHPDKWVNAGEKERKKAEEKFKAISDAYAKINGEQEEEEEIETNKEEREKLGKEMWEEFDSIYDGDREVKEIMKEYLLDTETPSLRYRLGMAKLAKKILEKKIEKAKKESIIARATKLIVVPQKREKILKESAKELTTITGEIIEVKEFKTWWNSNCATVINYDDFYRVFLVIYESERGSAGEKIKTFPVNHSDFQWWKERILKRENHALLDNAQNEAQSLRNELEAERGKYWIRKFEARIEMPVDHGCKIM